jgi:3-oxoacyl-[acyl-carrier-protein] synthase II
VSARVAITGLGPITAAGTGVEGLWRGLQAQVSPIETITSFDTSPWRTHFAAQVDDFRAEDHMDQRTARRLDRYSQFAIASAGLALADADLAASDLDPDRVAVHVGSALGGVAHAERQVVKFLEGGVRAVDPRVALHTFCGAASCNVAIRFGFTGPNSTNAMSCASGTIALGEAWRSIRSGEADAAIAAGVEAPLAPLSFGAFAIIRAMSARNDDPAAACRPFDVDRDGFVMGEGACALMLERWEDAEARGARIYGEICGFGVTNDAHHMTAPRPDGAQAARAIRRALQTGDVAAADVGIVSAHGSSTLLNDPTETRAIRIALGDHAEGTAVLGTKAYHGHALGASGAIEAAIALLAMRRRWLPPTLNLDRPDPACDLDYVGAGGRSTRATVALSNSFGFGGINGAIVLRAA